MHTQAPKLIIGRRRWWKMSSETFRNSTRPSNILVSLAVLLYDFWCLLDIYLHYLIFKKLYNPVFDMESLSVYKLMRDRDRDRDGHGQRERI